MESFSPKSSKVKVLWFKAQIIPFFWKPDQKANFLQKIILFSFLLGFGTVIVAQNKVNTVKINPLSLGVLTLNVQGERQLNDRFSAQMGAFLGGTSLSIYADELPEGIKYRWWGLTPELRYFISFNRMDVPKGFYVAPFLRFQRVREAFKGEAHDPDTKLILAGDVDLRRNSIGGGFMLGYQLITARNFVLDLYMGPKYSSANSKIEFSCSTCNGNEVLINQPGLHFDGIEIRAGLSLGFAF